MSVLVSAETKLFFFRVSGMMLSFGVSRKTLLITHWCFTCWTVLYRAEDVSVLLASCTILLARRLQGTRAGMGQNQDKWPELAKGIIHTIWHHVKKTVKLSRIGQGQGSTVTVWVWLGIGWQVVSNSLCITWFVSCFFCLSQQSLSQPTRSTLVFVAFFFFFPRFFPPSHWEESKRMTVVLSYMAG